MNYHYEVFKNSIKAVYKDENGKRIGTDDIETLPGITTSTIADFIGAKKAKEFHKIANQIELEMKSAGYKLVDLEMIKVKRKQYFSENWPDD